MKKKKFMLCSIAVGYAHVNCTFFLLCYVVDGLMDCNFQSLFDVAGINFLLTMKNAL